MNKKKKKLNDIITDQERGNDQFQQEKKEEEEETTSTAEWINKHGLSWPSKGTQERLTETLEERENRLSKLSNAIKTVIECVGEDPDREGLLKTPRRYAEALLTFTRGYEQDIKTVINDALFHEDHDEMVVVKHIEFFSLCEHHLVPFAGKVKKNK